VASDFRDEIALLRQRHDRKIEIAKASHKQWSQELAKAQRTGKEIPPRPPEAEMPEKFIEPQYYSTDSTIESLVPLIKVRPRGLMMINDELASWLSNMSRYNNGNDRGFWLTAWDGKPFTRTRVGSEPIHLERLLIGVLGGVQPDKLTELFKGPNDGLHARFLYSWPDEAPYHPLSNEHASSGEMKRVFEQLAQLPEVKGREKFIPLTRQALEAFEALRREVKEKAGLEGYEADWWAKVPAQVLRLSGTLAFLHAAGAGKKSFPPERIERAYVERAIELIKAYFWPHARAAFRQIGLTQTHSDARRVLRWFAARSQATASSTEIRREALSRKLDADATARVIQTLIVKGWLRGIEKPTDPEKGGRPTTQYEVNPRVHKNEEGNS